MKRMYMFKLTKKLKFFIEFWGYSFTANNFVVIPTLSVNIEKYYYSFAFSWLDKTIEFSFVKN